MANRMPQASKDAMAAKYERWATKQDELGNPKMAATMRQKAEAARRGDWRTFGFAR